MDLREYLRNDFSLYIRNRIIKNECEFCGSDEELHLHHISKFHNLLIETLTELNITERDTDTYTKEELRMIKYIMLGKQIKCEYKTLCKKCHNTLHRKEVFSKDYLDYYKNPFGNYMYVDLNHEFFANDNIKDGFKYRFLYLCTFMNYDGSIKFGKSKHNASKKDIFEILNISKTQYIYTVKCWKDNSLFRINNNGEIIISNSISCKGTPTNLKNKYRLFINPIKDKYESKNNKSHSALYKVYGLIPCCDNLNQIILDEYNKTTIKNIGLRVGTNYRNFTKEEFEYDGEKIIRKNKFNKYIISPKIFYNGTFETKVIEEFIDNI